MGAVGVKALVRPFFCYANTTATHNRNQNCKHDRNQNCNQNCNRNPKPGSHPYLSATLKPENHMTRYEEIITNIIEFRNERDWEQFHDAKNLALALMLEAAELNELFLWKKEDEIDSIDIDRIKEELADVLTYSFFLAHKYNLDIFQIVEEKMIKNGQKYPRDKARGTAKKYTEL